MAAITLLRKRGIPRIQSARLLCGTWMVHRRQILTWSGNDCRLKAIANILGIARDALLARLQSVRHEGMGSAAHEAYGLSELRQASVCRR